MIEKGKLFKDIEANEGLAAELKKAWLAGAGPEELSALLVAQGIDADPAGVEEILAGVNAAREKEIEARDLDLDQLEAVAGGGNGKCEGTANCDENFISQSSRPLEDRCDLFTYCDQSLACTSNSFLG